MGQTDKIIIENVHFQNNKTIEIRDKPESNLPDIQNSSPNFPTNP